MTLRVATVAVIGAAASASPILRQLSFLLVVLLFLGIMGLVFSQKMVDPEKARAERLVVKPAGRTFVPNHILTDTGRQMRIASLVSLALGLILAVTLSFLTSK